MIEKMMESNVDLSDTNVNKKFAFLNDNQVQENQVQENRDQENRDQENQLQKDEVQRKKIRVHQAQVESQETLNELMSEWEKKGEKALTKMYSSPVNEVIPSFENLLNDTNKDFKKKMGRPMSYSEMRMMYG